MEPEQGLVAWILVLLLLLGVFAGLVVIVARVFVESPEQRQARLQQEEQQRQAAQAAQVAAWTQARAAQAAQAAAWQAELTQREGVYAQQQLARVSVAQGPAGRRAVAEAALLKMTALEVRRWFLLGVSRIEVEAALAKAHGYKTPDVKRRVLLEALAAVRADQIPDELQADQVAAIEAALRDLEGLK
jgi:hypothetical protein